MYSSDMKRSFLKVLSKMYMQRIINHLLIITMEMYFLCSIVFLFSVNLYESAMIKAFHFGRLKRKWSGFINEIRLLFNFLYVDNSEESCKTRHQKLDINNVLLALLTKQYQPSPSYERSMIFSSQSMGLFKMSNTSSH